MSDIVRFGPSGNDILFYEQGFKSTIQAMPWVAQRGLSAFEISFGRGIRMSEETARAIGQQAAKHGVLISAHAPYFINLAREFEKSYMYIEKSLKLLKLLGGRNLVVHTGSQGELSRSLAMKNCKENFRRVFAALEKNPEFADFDFRICPETMGRFSSIGDHREVCEICSIHERLVPTLDFGHMNCLLQGGLSRDGAVNEIMDYCMQHVSAQKMKNVHIHFSPVKFGQKGELSHLDFVSAPEIFTPPFVPLAKYIKSKNLAPTIICESAERMAQDSVTLLKTFEKV